MITASAPAKLILCGEHAVVYGRPAIALPLSGIRASVTIEARHTGTGIIIDARDLQRRWLLAEKPDDPISTLVLSTREYLRAPHQALRITISSSIPIASGMGSGAAVATAMVRALAAHAGHTLPPAEVSALVFASERRYHGTPSGIDNTVIAYEQPIWFVRQESGHQQSENTETPGTKTSAAQHAPTPPLIAPIAIALPFTLLIADTGVRSATRLPVGEVRRRWQADPARYEALFDQVGELTTHARAMLASGDLSALGALLNLNHALLQQIGVASPELDTLVHAAQHAGALGAKLSGAGWGGIMFALVAPDQQTAVRHALLAAGAKRVMETTVLPHAG